MASSTQGFADPEVAMTEWNCRVALPPEKPTAVAEVFGFTRKNLIRGELVSMTLDRTGVFTSDQIALSPGCTPLVRRPSD